MFLQFKEGKRLPADDDLFDLNGALTELGNFGDFEFTLSPDSDKDTTACVAHTGHESAEISSENEVCDVLFYIRSFNFKVK